MLLRVKNLGPVREAELDLGKPLIVLTGPNNSGKTYLAWVAYSLARLDGTRVEPPPSLSAWVDKLFASEDQILDLGSLRNIHGDVLPAIATAVREKLPEDFAASRRRFDGTTIELISADDGWPGSYPSRGPHATTHEGYLINFEFGNDRIQLSIHEFQSFTDTRGQQLSTISVASLSNEQIAAAKAGATKLAVVMMMGALLDRRHVALPVERLAINLFARELAAERAELVDELLIDAADSSAPSTLREKLQSRAKQYPLVIRDALQTAMRLSSKARTGPLADLADELETSVLGGSITLDSNDDIRFTPRQDPKQNPLGLHESASVVKSLVSLVLFLRHNARPGQRLVIDEPELNLHPDNQRLVTRILAKAVNRGLKVMMSTHSDYVIRELNNLLMLGQGNPDKARALVQELGYQPEQILRKDQIAAYLVNDGACTLLAVTETGFETKTIEDEIHKLNQDTQTIYFRLSEDED